MNRKTFKVKEIQPLRKLADPLFAALLSIIVSSAFLIFSPAHTPVPHTDSGIFLHIGSELLKGKVLYLQTWDNKQPLLYLINAVGLWLGNGSAWGVWGVELALFISALILVFFMLRKALPPFASFVVTSVSFLNIFQIMSGNYSEEYSVCLQISILAVLFFIYLPGKRRFSRPLAACAMGIFSGLAFCLKQTYLESAGSIVLLILFLSWLERDRKMLGHLLWMAEGFLLVNAPVFLYFYAHGALDDYMVSAFLINKYYSSQGLLEWLHSGLETIEFTTTNPMLFFILTIWLSTIFFLFVRAWETIKKIISTRFFNGLLIITGLMCFTAFGIAQLHGGNPGIGLLEWVAVICGSICITGAVILFFKKLPPQSIDIEVQRQKLASLNWNRPGETPFLFLGMIELPIILFTISLSGKGFTHYYISLLIPLILLFGASVMYLNRLTRKLNADVIFNCLLAALLLAGSFAPTLQILTRLRASGEAIPSDASYQTAQYLHSVTTPQDTILVWGWQAGIYYMADREPCTRFSFQFPIYFESPFQEQALSTLLSDIRSNPPAYIADTMDVEMPFIEGQTSEECLISNPANGNNLQGILNYVCSNYKLDRIIGDIHIYRLIS